MKKSKKMMMPSIRIDWRNDKGLNPDGKYTLNFFIRFNGKTVKRATGIFLDPSNWDVKKKKIKFGNCELLDKQWRELEARMNKFSEDWLDVRLRKKSNLTWDDVLDTFESRKFDSFSDYCNRFLTDRMIKPATKIKYERNLRIFFDYCESKKITKVCFDDITPPLLADFNRFLLKGRGMQLDSAYNYHKNLKTILKEAKKERLIDTSPYECGFEARKSNVAPEIEPLEKEEIDAVMNLDLSEHKKVLNLTRDYYVFILNTGLRFGDFSKLNARAFKSRTVKNYKGDETKMYYLELVQEKSSRKVLIPLNLEARRIFFKYRQKNKGEEFVFNSICNQSFNKNLKKIASLAGIEKRLYCHLGRHSFATNLRSTGASLEDISTLLGHADIRMTKRYAQPDNSRLVSAVEKLHILKKIA